MCCLKTHKAFKLPMHHYKSVKGFTLLYSLANYSTEGVQIYLLTVYLNHAVCASQKLNLKYKQSLFIYTPSLIHRAENYI